MTPKEYLSEAFQNVKRALQDTLRYDYGPEETLNYYTECNQRLEQIEKHIKTIKNSEVWALLNDLDYLSSWISLIERSRLGEFSWPFAAIIRKIAQPLLGEKTLKGDIIEPIIHVVAEGEGYQIVYEKVPPISSNQRFTIVAFPRPLKHHVLLHTIFGHEIGHTAQNTNTAGDFIRIRVRNELRDCRRLADTTNIKAWMKEAGRRKR